MPHAFGPKGMTASSSQPEHIVQLFDTTASMADTVAAYVADGLDAAEQVLVAVTPPHWMEVARRLPAKERFPLAAGRGHLTVLDAETLLKEFVVGGAPDAALFDATVGALVRRLTLRGRPLRIYGEMVDILAADGDLPAAEQLEQLWNDLAASARFTLFCGYSSVHFGNPRTAAALQHICQAHTHVVAAPADELATWLLESPPPPQIVGDVTEA